MEQLTKKQERALDKMIKAVSRRFPFITGWKPSEDFLAYDTMLNIDFIIDVDKLGEFFKTEPEPYYRRVIDSDGPYEVYSLGSPFDYDKNPHIKDLSYDTSAKIEELHNSSLHYPLYRGLPPPSPVSPLHICHFVSQIGGIIP